MLNRIYILIMVVLILAIIVPGIVTYQAIATYHDKNTEARLLAAARLVSLKLDEGAGYDAAGRELASVFSDDATQMRLTIVDSEGLVLFDNSADPAVMDNHLYRPEIAYAINNNAIGTAVRRSSSVGSEMLYLVIYDQDSGIAVRTALPLAEHRAGVDGIVRVNGITLVVVLTILAAIGLFSARVITRPLQAIELAAAKMAAGDYTVRLEKMSREDGEVARLSDAFNQMADRLQATVEDLAARNAQLDTILNAMTDPVLAVTESTAVTFMNRHARDLFGRDLDPDKAVYPLILITHSRESEQLVQKAIAAGQMQSGELSIQTVKGADIFQVTASPFNPKMAQGVILTFHNISEMHKLQKMRSDFVANVTHELRTPLTSIRGFIETLREGAINNPEVAGRFLEIIDIEADRLHRLISDILVLSEIEEMKEDRERENFDLNALIEDVTVLLDEAATRKNISILAEDTESPLTVSANRFRIKQVLINLADNAIKYNREKGKITIHAWRLNDSTVRIQVHDTGYGILPEHRERIFERFYRVDKSRSRAQGGTGLGLSIVKHIAQLYDGQAKVESEPGKGSTFTVDLKI